MTGNTTNQTACIFVILYAVVLAGCGGGGGGGGMATGGTAAPMYNPTLVGNIDNPASASAQAKGAASATPAAGSVTQSSTVNGSNVTSHTVSATADYTGNQLHVSVTDSRAGADGWGTVDSNDILVRANILQADGTGTSVDYQERLYAKPLDDGRIVLVDVFTDRAGAGDTDYLSGGVWLVAPADADTAPASEWEGGAFIDSPIDPTPISYLAAIGSATYGGDATGIYSERRGATYEIGEFAAEVDLTATFGSARESAAR